MIRLTALLRRNPALTPAEFEAHWRDAHAAAIRGAPGVGSRVVRYEQHPRLEVPPGSWGGTEGFDGMTVQWYRSRDDFEAMLRSPGYRDVVAPDERRLLDVEGGIYLLTSEPRVVIGES